MQDKELNIGDLTDGAIGFVKKNWYFLLLFVGLGFVLGFVQYNRAQPQYQTNVYAKSTFVPIDLIKNEISSINALIEEGNIEMLAEKMGVSDSIAANYGSFKFFTVSKEDDIFSIEVKCSGEHNHNQILVEGFAKYLESNAFLAEFLEEERKIIENRNELSKQELKKLIIIQDGIISGANSLSQNLISDPANLSNKIIELESTILLNEIRLNDVTPYRIIDSVDILSSPSLKRSILSSVIVCLFFGSFLLFTFRLFWKKP